MTHTSIYKNFIPSIAPADINSLPAKLFIFNANKILINKAGEKPDIPSGNELGGLKPSVVSKQYLGTLTDCPCYCIEVNDGFCAPDGLQFVDLRALLGRVEEDIFLLAGRAFQIVNWNRMNKFCGKCGGETRLKENELAKECPRCGSVYYPRLSPAVIVAVVRDDKILLAHNKNFGGNWYSVIAGFVEPGETFEDCVAREVMEEVGISVKNIKYFGSQPWPFPDSLMVGFTADYADGEIKVDGEEIDAADWYGADNLPQRPSKASIAGRLIDFVIATK
jgi:NAD+ diphosphatase